MNGPNDNAVTPSAMDPNLANLNIAIVIDGLCQQYTFNKYTIYTGLTYTKICFIFKRMAKQSADFKHFSSHIYAMLNNKMPKRIPLYWK